MAEAGPLRRRRHRTRLASRQRKRAEALAVLLRRRDILKTPHPGRSRRRQRVPHHCPPGLLRGAAPHHASFRHLRPGRRTAPPQRQDARTGPVPRLVRLNVLHAPPTAAPRGGTPARAEALVGRPRARASHTPAAAAPSPRTSAAAAAPTSPASVPIWAGTIVRPWTKDRVA